MAVTPFTPKTCLQIANAALGELGFTQVLTLNGNTDPGAIQMLTLLNKEGEELRDTPEEGWTAMQTEFNLVVNAPVITTGNVSLNSPVVSGIPTTAGLTAGNWLTLKAIAFDYTGESSALGNTDNRYFVANRKNRIDS